MRAGTSIPGLAAGGISHTQSPTLLTLSSSLSPVFISEPLDVDHQPRPPAALDRLQRELVEGHGLGVGAERGPLGIDDPTLDLGLQMEGALPAHADLAARKHLAVAVLEED